MSDKTKHAADNPAVAPPAPRTYGVSLTAAEIRLMHCAAVTSAEELSADAAGIDITVDLGALRGRLASALDFIDASGRRADEGERPAAADTIQPDWLLPADYPLSSLSDRLTIAASRIAPDISPITIAALLRETADKLDPVPTFPAAGGPCPEPMPGDLPSMDEVLDVLQQLRNAADAIMEPIVIQKQATDAEIMAVELALENTDDLLMVCGRRSAGSDDAPIGAVAELDGRVAA